MTYSAWVFEDAAHIPASESIPQLFRQPPPPPPQPTVATEPRRPDVHHTRPRQQHADRQLPPPRLACPLQLGVNRSTGRLQWFPSCRYAKIMVLLPVALAPVVLLLLLISHLETVDSVRHQYHLEQRHRPSDEMAGDRLRSSNAVDADAPDEWDAAQSLLSDGERQIGADGPRQCTAVRYALFETLDSVDSDLLRDVRTSFVPPDYVYASPDCVADELAVSEMRAEEDVGYAVEDDESDALPELVDEQTTRTDDDRGAASEMQAEEDVGYALEDDEYDALTELVDEQTRRTDDDRGDAADRSYDDRIEYRQRREAAGIGKVNVTEAIRNVPRVSVIGGFERKPIPAVVPLEGSA